MERMIDMAWWAFDIHIYNERLFDLYKYVLESFYGQTYFKFSKSQNKNKSSIRTYICYFFISIQTSRNIFFLILHFFKLGFGLTLLTVLSHRDNFFLATKATGSLANATRFFGSRDSILELTRTLTIFIISI